MSLQRVRSPIGFDRSIPKSFTATVAWTEGTPADAYLPSSLPTDPQLSFTVDASTVPVITGSTPILITYLCNVILSFQRINASNGIIYYKIYTNGNLTIDSSVSANGNNYYYTQIHQIPVVSGDVITVKMYTSIANFAKNKTYHFRNNIAPVTFPKNLLIKDYTVTMAYLQPTTGNPSVLIATNNTQYTVAKSSNTSSTWGTSTKTINFNLYNNDGYPPITTVSFQSTSAQTSLTYYPYIYTRTGYISAMTWKESLAP